MLGNIKQPPLTPKLSTSCAGVDLTLPTMTSHGAYTYPFLFTTLGNLNMYMYVFNVNNAINVKSGGCLRRQKGEGKRHNITSLIPYSGMH